MRRRPSGRPKAKRSGGMEKIVAWMCCDPLPPVPLGQKLLMTLGRSDASDLTLPHKEVSRRHAVVKVLGKTLVLEDEGSSNGSYLNGKRVSSTLLKVGDKITIGPYDIEIRSTDDMVEHDRESSTKSMELTSVSRINPSASLTGLLDEVPAVELLQQLEFNKKTGTLDVHHSDTHGQLVVANGLPVWARYEELADDEAVIAMALLKRGRFSFSANVEPGDKTMNSRLTGLLFEASRRMDENQSALDTAALAESAIGEALATMDEHGDVVEETVEPEAKTEHWNAAEAAARGINLSGGVPRVEGFGSEDTDVAEVPAFEEVQQSDEDRIPEAAQDGEGAEGSEAGESDHDWDLTGSK